MFIFARPPVPPLGATMITTTTTAAMLGAVVAAVAGAALAPAMLPPAHAAAGEPGTLIFSFGERGSSSPYEFSGIVDVVVAPDGKIIVLDLDPGNGIRVFHPNGTLYFMTDAPFPVEWGDGVYAAPDGKIIAQDDFTYHVFDPNGTHAFVFELEMERPELYFAPNGDFVMFENRSSIAVFRNYTHIYSIGEAGAYYGELWALNAIGVAPDGKIFAADYVNDRVEVFHLNGTHAYSFRPFEGLSYWYEIGPTGEFLSHAWQKGHLYLFYPNGARAGVLSANNTSGGVVGGFGPDGTITVRMGRYQIGVFNGIDPADTWPPPPSFMGPSGLPVSVPPPFMGQPRPPMSVPPPLSLAAATPAFEFGSYGEGPGEFLAPHNIAFGPGGVIAVSDAENNRIQLFHPNGTFALEVGSRGSGLGEFAGPLGLTFGPNGLLAVSDVGNHRVQVFRVQ